MKNEVATPRRAAALVFVLAALVMTTTTLVVVVRRATTADRCLAGAHDLRLAHAFFEASHAPIREWLVLHSGDVVLPPTVLEPRVEVLRDEVQWDATTVRVNITAWDLEGMAPLAIAVASPSIRHALPAHLQQHITDLGVSGKDVDGLDQLPFSAFPTPAQTGAFGGIVAVRPRVRQGGPEPVPRINVSTAPMRLVRSALRIAGRSGIEVIAAEREAQRMPIPRMLPQEDDSRSVGSLHLTGTSSSWAFRVDIDVHAHRCSWWLVYVLVEGTWRRVQTLVVHDHT